MVVNFDVFETRTFGDFSTLLNWELDFFRGCFKNLSFLEVCIRLGESSTTLIVGVYLIKGFFFDGAGTEIFIYFLLGSTWKEYPNGKIDAK